MGKTCARLVDGVAGDVLGNEITLGLLDTVEKDVLDTDGTSGAVISYSFTDNTFQNLGGAAVRYSNEQYKVVFLSFDLSSVLNTHPVLSPPSGMLEKVFTWFEIETGVEDIGERQLLSTPYGFRLHPNYPNPFRRTTGSTTTLIDYSVGRHALNGLSSQHVTISIYDLLGRKVVTLVNEPKAPGEYSIAWDGNSENGLKVSAGVHFVELRSGSIRKTHKLLVLN